MSLRWFGVKTLFRTRARGSPRVIDKDFDPDVESVEERIVLFRARSFDEAIARAEAEARGYAADAHRNPYGQKVVTEYLGTCDAFWLFEPPDSGVEVFSEMTLVPSGESRRALVDRWFGTPERKGSRRYVKFLDRQLFGDVRPAGASGRRSHTKPTKKSRAQPLSHSRNTRG